VNILNINTKSKLKKGFLNPVMLLGIIAIILLFIFGSKISDKLSIGIADDYIIYDDFQKGYLDYEIWDIDFTGGYWNGYSVADEPNRISFSDGWVSYSKYVTRKNAGVGTFNYISSDLVLIPSDITQGMSIKTQLMTEKNYWGTGGSDTYFASTSSLIINDLVVYTCRYPDGVGFTKRTCSVEAIPSFEYPEIYFIKVNGEEYQTINTSNAQGDGRIKFILSGGIPTPTASYAYDIGANAKSYIDYVKYKIPYNCKIEDDEILVFDSFSENSIVNISSLAYEPVKFCLDYPIKARSFSADGIKTDIRGEILQKIVRGQSAVVAPAEEWKVFYITKNTPNIELRCDIGEAYDTNTGICENPSERAIVGCKLTSDCYIPPGCTGVSSSCADNKCEYVGSCIYKPQKESTSLWDKIMSIGFMQWIAGLFK